MQQQMLEKLYNQLVSQALEMMEHREYLITTISQPRGEPSDTTTTRLFCNIHVTRQLMSLAIDMNHRGIEDVTSAGLYTFEDEELDNSMEKVKQNLTTALGTPVGGISIDKTPKQAVNSLFSGKVAKGGVNNIQDYFIVIHTWEKHDVLTKSTKGIHLLSYIESGLRE